MDLGLMAWVWTSVCVMFAALGAKRKGSRWSGDGRFRLAERIGKRITLTRFAQADVIPTSTNAVPCDTDRTWNRPEAAELAKLFMTS